jgi:hypothetical protein
MVDTEYKSILPIAFLVMLLVVFISAFTYNVGKSIGRMEVASEMVACSLTKTTYGLTVWACDLKE